MTELTEFQEFISEIAEVVGIELQEIPEDMDELLALIESQVERGGYE